MKPRVASLGQVAEMVRNGRPFYVGISGRYRPESVAEISGMRKCSDEIIQPSFQSPRVPNIV